MPRFATFEAHGFIMTAVCGNVAWFSALGAADVLRDTSLLLGVPACAVLEERLQILLWDVIQTDEVASYEESFGRTSSFLRWAPACELLSKALLPKLLPRAKAALRSSEPSSALPHGPEELAEVNRVILSCFLFRLQLFLGVRVLPIFSLPPFTVSFAVRAVREIALIVQCHIRGGAWVVIEFNLTSRHVGR